MKNHERRGLLSVRMLVSEELAKMKEVFTFEKGDFADYDTSLVFAPLAKSSRRDGAIDWCKSFRFLAETCLSLGGRVMSKPNDGLYWSTPFWEQKYNSFNISEKTNTVESLFHFPTRELCDQFLSTEGVKENWLLFMQVDTNTK